MNVKKKKIKKIHFFYFSALHIARTMGQVGHRVIIAERDPVFGLSLTRFSRHVYKFINFTARSKADYVEALVKIWHKHNIDWFIPIRLV